jgi:hypothetical protein
MARNRLGATGQFPHGKLNADDEGELRLAISRQGDLIRIDFGKPVAWLGLYSKEARAFAEAILKHAKGDA